jgi:tetratricopeptide (TPR) repeat protein
MTESDPAEFDLLWDYDQPAESEARFRELLAKKEEGSSDYVQLLTQIARAQGLQRKFDEAHETLDQAERLLTEELKRARIRYLLERGRVFNSSRQPEQAYPYFIQAWNQAAGAGEDFYVVDAIHMLGIIDSPEKQLDWNLKALELAEQSADPRAQNWRGSLYNNIGWTYHDRGDYEQALENFQRALEWRIQQGRAAEIRIAKWCAARTLRSLKQLEEALALQRELEREYLQAGEESGYVYEELAEVLLALDQPAEARDYFTRAYTELSKDPWLLENEPARLERLKTLGGMRSR